MKKLLRLENLIYLTVFGLPLYLVRLDLFGIPANILDVLESAVFFWWILDKNYLKPKPIEIFFKYKNYLIAVGLIFFGLITSTLLNGEYKTGLGIIKSWFLLPLLFSFVALNVINREKIKNIFMSIYASSVVVSLIALVYYFLGRLTYDGRLKAFFNSPNYLAMYLAPALIIGLTLAQSQNVKVKMQKVNLKIKSIYSIGCVIIFLSLYLTYSYAAWIAVASSLLSAELIKRRANIVKSKVFWGALVLAALIFSSQLNSGKLRNTYTFSERSSLTSRIMIWKTAGKLAKDNPFWGIGPGNFQNKYLEYQKFFPPYLEWAVPHPHNLFFAFFLYSGLTGIVGFSLLIFFWFRDVLRKEDSTLKIIFLALMAYALIHGLVDTTYFKNDLAVIFWLNFLALNLKKTLS